MVHAQVLKCIYFTLMYTTHHIFTVLPIKHLVNQDSEPNTPQKLATVTKLLVSNIRVLFCPYGVQKPTSHVNREALNMCHQPQKGFGGIFVVIPQHRKGYLIYIPSTRKMVSSHKDLFYQKIKCISIHVTSIFRGTCGTTRDILHCTRYILSHKNWQHYKFYTV